MTKFAKPALSFPDLLNLLESRGLKIEDRSWALPRLKQIGYYRLCAYGKPLLEACASGAEPRYKKFTSFGLLLRLYAFDRKLRALTFEAIEIIEVAARACISDTMSSNHGAHWFLNENYFSPKTGANDLWLRLDEEFFHPGSSTPKDAHSEFINEYFRTYSEPKYPPSWMLSEILTLGRWSKIYESLAGRYQKEIAGAMGHDYENIVSWLRGLTIIRNICAHHGHLWNRTLPSVRVTPEIAAAGVIYYKYGVHAAVILNLLRTIRPSYKWAEKLRDLFESYPEVDPKAVGFVRRWDHREFWGLHLKDSGCYQI